MDETVIFFACWYRFSKIKSWSKLFWLGMVKNGCGQSDLWTPKLLYVKNEWMELTDFLHAGTNSHRLKRWLKDFRVSMVKSVVDQSVDGTLKLTVSKEWTDVTKLIFCMLMQIHKNWKLVKNGEIFTSFLVTFFDF